MQRMRSPFPGNLATPSRWKRWLSLGNVDNVADVSKPISLAQQAALNLKADISSVGAANASFSAHKNGSSQAGVANGTWTKITHGTEVYDVGGFFDAVTNFRWTPPARKVKMIVAFNANAGTFPTSGDRYTIAGIYKNGNVLKKGIWYNTMNSESSALIAADDVANGTDYYEAWGYVALASGTCSFNGATDVTYFMGTVI